MPSAAEIITLTKQVAASYQDSFERVISVTGIVTKVVIAYPAGCHQLVDVRLLYISPKGGSRIPIVPTQEDQFIALDNYTTYLEPMHRVERGGRLVAEWWNYDGRNAHQIPIIVQVTPE